MKLLDEYTLLVGEPVGCPQLHSNVEIAGAARIHPRQATATEVKDLATLRTGRNLQCRARHDRRYHDIRTQHELPVREQHLRVQLLTITLEARIISNFENH